ncbi:hypothetical protein GGX14DRAFT_667907 [Mycena pura]|uniref:Uncharacterized protein n=1 Tax=Mycena pura TaxID=153505 RepID=A0AAD6V1M4_9AGAR|nr:hypothetical protein GGX14DRAFT_667907 [Mycena pura]
MFEAENSKINPLFAEFFGHDLGVQELPTVVDTDAAESSSNPARRAGRRPRPRPAHRRDPARTLRFRAAQLALVIYVAALMLANPSHVKGLKLHFSIYEMQSEDEAGSGYSCQTTCDGALNTGVPGQVAIPGAKAAGVAGLDADIGGLTDLANAITAELEKNIAKAKEEVKEANLAALELFAEAIHAGKVDASEAFTTRGIVGKIQQPKIERALAYIQEHMQDVLTVERFFETEVVELVVANPRKPQLKVRKVGAAAATVPTAVEFDFVHLANGTPWTALVTGETVSSAIPNQHGVGKFLTAKGLMVTEGPNAKPQIRGGAHIGIVGLSLSAYDYVPLLLRYTSLVVPTDSGYDIDPKDAEKYQGLLTFISRTGESAPPRIVNPKHFADPQPILTSAELHALQLQKRFDWLTFWKVFLDANVARALGTLPTDLAYKKAMTPKERMVHYARQIEAHRNGSLTEAGLLHAGYSLAYGGQGFYADPATAERELVGKAPLTRTDRAGFLLRRGSLAEISSLAYVSQQSNKAFFDEYTTMHNHVAASPPAIQYLVARMFELGVATHAAGDATNAAFVKSLDSSVLLAPLSLDRKADAVLVGLKQRVKEVVQGQPEYAKGRFLRTPGNALVHAIDMGMGGQGTRVVSPGPANAVVGDQSIVGMRWSDTSFLDAAAYGAASLAPVTVLLSSIAAKGDPQPAERLLAYYKAGLPSPAKFDSEVAQFKAQWTEVHEKRAFLLLCAEAAADAAQYLKYTDQVFTAATRKQLVAGFTQQKLHGAAVGRYENAVEGIPAFDPPSVEDYFERFVDLSPAEIQSCWDAHMTV